MPNILVFPSWKIDVYKVRAKQPRQLYVCKRLPTSTQSPCLFSSLKVHGTTSCAYGIGIEVRIRARDDKILLEEFQTIDEMYYKQNVFTLCITMQTGL